MTGVVRLELSPAQQERIRERAGVRLSSITLGAREVVALSLAAAAAGRDVLACARSPETIRAILYPDASPRRPFTVEVPLDAEQAARIEAVTKRRPSVLVVAPADFRTTSREPWQSDEARQVGSFLIVTRQTPLPAVFAADRVIALPRPAAAGPGVFGTGRHATTRLALLLTPAAVPDGGRVLDLGTGTGILAIAAARVGAERVDAIDIDPAAVALASESVRLNGLADVVRVTCGSLPDAEPPYQAVLMNLLPDLLHTMVPRLPALLRLRGRAVVSGIPSSRAAGMRDVLETAGMRVLERREIGSWTAMLVSAAACR